MTNGARTTGTRDKHYNLVSVLYHALQAADTYTGYISDAEQSNDSELAEFFRQAQDQDHQRAEQAKALLGKRLE